MPRAVVPLRRAGRLLIAALVSLAGVLVACALGGALYASESAWADHALEVRRAVFEWSTVLLGAEVAARGHLASEPPGALPDLDGLRAQERVQHERVRALVADNPGQAERVDAATRDAQTALDDLGRMGALVAAGRVAEARSRLASGADQATLDRFTGDLRALRDEEARLLADRRARAARWGSLALGGVGAISVAAVMLLALVWRRERAHELRVESLAREARQRLRTLSELAGALSSARTQEEVASVIVDQASRAASADTCTLYLLDDDGEALDLIGDRGVAPDVLDKIRRITATSGTPATLETVRSGAALWVENEAQYAAIYPSLATVKTGAPRAHAFWSVPLVAEERPLGLLGVGFYAPRTFSADERAFVETLTQQCAQALLRAIRREREDEARQWLDTTLRSIGDAVIATDDEGRVTLLNPVAERLTGWPEAEARGEPLDRVFSIFAEQTREVAESPVARVLREGVVVGLANHTILRSRQGREIPIDDSAAPIRSSGGGIAGVVLVFRDVTAEKRAHARDAFLAKAGETLVSSLDLPDVLATVARLAVPSLADWCSVDLVDPGATAPRSVAVAHADPDKVAFARALGQKYPSDPNATTGVPQVVRTGQPELYPEIPAAMLEAGARDAEHLKLIRELKLESAMVVPLRGRARVLGAMTFVYAESGRRYDETDLAFAVDLARRAALAIDNATALQAAEQARAREQALRGEAELANRAKDEFLATVSHELRTPLNAILGWTVMLRGRKPGQELEQGLVVIERNARQQTRLIEDVLDVSRIISGKLALNLGPTRVAQAITAAIDTVTPAAQAKQIVIEADVVDDGLVLMADGDRLQQIAWNLLSNAVKFTPKGGRVRVSASREGSEVWLLVSDTGEGIRPDVLPLVFEPFLQADATTTRRHGGLGLGLAIVKQLVVAHGGTVRAESEGPGRGATFVVRLPARGAVPALGAALERRAGVLPAEAAPPRLDGLTILVVDDEQDARELLREVFAGLGAEVLVAPSVAEGLQLLAAARPHVLVSDIGMPEQDGLTFIRKIRGLDPRAGGGIPAVALTAYARDEDARRALEAGFQRHVAKPVEPFELARVVAELGVKGDPVEGAD